MLFAWVRDQRVLLQSTHDYIVPDTSFQVLNWSHILLLEATLKTVKSVYLKKRNVDVKVTPIEAPQAAKIATPPYAKMGLATQKNRVPCHKATTTITRHKNGIRSPRNVKVIVAAVESVVIVS